MMTRAFAALLTLLALVPAAGARSEGAQDAPSGATLLVQVRVRGPLPPPNTAVVDRDRDSCGPTVTIQPAIVDPASRGLQDTAVWVDAPPVHRMAIVRRTAETGAADPPASLTNRDCRFEPPVLLAQVGRKLEVRNDDRILHNTHIAGPDRTFLNIAMPAGIAPIVKTMKEPGIYPVRCDAHPFMSATVVGLDHAFAAVTGHDGVARIAGVPAGQRTVTVWHATLGTLLRAVTVPAQGTVTVTFEYGE